MPTILSPKGRKYGFEVKAEASNNSIKQRANVYEKSVDYRTLDAPVVALGGIGGRCWTIPTESTSVSTDAINLGRIKPTALPPPTKQDNFDAMLAYAYRSKGNYFSGKKGAERYGYIDEAGEDSSGAVSNAVADEISADIAYYVEPGTERNLPQL